MEVPLTLAMPLAGVGSGAEVAVTWDLSGQTFARIRRPSSVQVTGHGARVPMDRGLAKVEVGKSSFRVLLVG